MIPESMEWVTLYYDPVGIRINDYAIADKAPESMKKFVEAHGQPRLGPTLLHTSVSLFDASRYLGARMGLAALPIPLAFEWVVTLPITDAAATLLRATQSTWVLKRIWVEEGPIMTATDPTFSGDRITRQVNAVLKEWRRGCSNNLTGHPEDCAECTAGALNAIDKIVNGETHEHQKSIH